MKYLFLVFIAFSLIISCSSSDDTCHKPLSLHPTSIDENYVNFLYEEVNDTSTSVVEYGEPGFELGVDAIGVSRSFSLFYYVGIGGDFNSHRSMNLEPNTTYEAYIKSECSINNYSEYYGPVLFTTLALGEGCTKPDSLVVLEKTSTTILIDWEGYNKEDWLVEIIFYDDGWDEYITHEVSEKPFLIEGLTPETNYYITVRTNYCDGLFETSMPSNEITVVTNE